MSLGDLVYKIANKRIDFVYLSIIYIYYILIILDNDFGRTIHIDK